MARLFISHSHHDSTFARCLTATLTAAGIPTFFAPRDVLVGNSIPDRVFSEMATATHAVIILSRNSVNSRWVGDEVAAARMRALSDGDCAVLPVLVEDVVLPDSIRHLRYADFREWKSDHKYQVAVLELLRAIGVTAPPATGLDLAWYARFRGALVDLSNDVLFAAGVLDGALLIQSMHPEYDQGSAIKYALLNPDVLTRLDKLRQVLPATSAWLRPLRDALAELGESKAIRGAGRTRAGSSALLHQLHAVARELHALQEDVDNLAFGQLAIDRSDLGDMP